MYSEEWNFWIVAADAEQGVAGARQILVALRIRVETEIVQHARHDVLRRVEHVDPAILELADELRPHDDVPAVESGLPEPLLNPLHIDADAGRAPHVVDGVRVAGIEQLQTPHDLRPHMLQVRQLGLVELAEDAGGDQPLQERPGRHDDVVARLSGQELGFDDLVVVVGVVDHPDAGLLGEILEHLRVDIVRPVIDIDRALLRGGAGQESEQDGERGNDTGHVRRLLRGEKREVLRLGTRAGRHKGHFMG